MKILKKNMQVLKIKLLIVLSVFAWSNQSKTQASFEEALVRFAKKEAPQFSENLVVKKSESTRNSNAKAFRINQLYELQRELTSQKGVSKRAAIGKDDKN